MRDWGDLLRDFPEALICAALLYFGSGMLDRASDVPIGLQIWLAYFGPIMMLVGGIGLILILLYTFYRLYRGKATG